MKETKLAEKAYLKTIKELIDLNIISRLNQKQFILNPDLIRNSDIGKGFRAVIEIDYLLSKKPSYEEIIDWNVNKQIKVNKMRPELTSKDIMEWEIETEDCREFDEYMLNKANVIPKPRLNLEIATDRLRADRLAGKLVGGIAGREIAGKSINDIRPTFKINKVTGEIL
jgi:hypothetical protein